MASMSSLSVSTVKERIKKKEVVHFLTFQFSVAHKNWDLKTIREKVIELGWEKLPDIDSTYVWFGEKPRLKEATEILKKSSFDNHICRYFTGILTDADELEGTGVPPPQKEPLQSIPQKDRSIPEFFKPTKTGPDSGKEN